MPFLPRSKNKRMIPLCGGFLLLSLFLLLAPNLHREIFAQEPFSSPIPEVIAEANAPSVLSFYLSPNQMVRAQFIERLLNSPVGSTFFSRLIEQYDSRHLRHSESTPLMKQLRRTFGQTAPSLNGPVNLFFFNLQGVWGNAEVTREMTLEPGDPYLIYLSDFAPDEILGLTTAFLAEANFAENVSQEKNAMFPRLRAFFRPRKANDSPLLLDYISPLPDDNGKSLFFVTRSLPIHNRIQNEFLQSQEISNALSGSDPLFLAIGITNGVIDRAADWLAQQEDRPEKVFAPTLKSLAKRIETVEFSAQERSGITTVTLVCVCKENESSEDLQTLFEGGRKLYTEWMADQTPTPGKELILDLIQRTEIVQENEDFFLILKLDAPETEEKLEAWIEANQ